MKWKKGFVEEQFKLLKDKWEELRTDVPIDLSSTFYNKGDLMEGVYAEVHKVKYHYTIPALKMDGFV
eukprot:11329305-Prorocentrum_lima.AAC.1